MSSPSRLKGHALGLVFFALAGGLGWGVVQALSAPERGEDGCLASGAPIVEVVALDSSDPVPDTGLKRLIDRIVDLAMRLAPDVRLMVVTFGGEAQTDVVPILSACNPANASGALAGDLYRKRMTAKLLEGLTPWMEELNHNRRSTSPILEGVERLRFMKEVAEAEETRLTLVSDLIQNSPGLSHIPGQPGYRRPNAGNAPRPDPLASATWARVRLVQIQRVELRALQTRDQLAWWAAFFAQISMTPPVLEKL